MSRRFPVSFPILSRRLYKTPQNRRKTVPNFPIPKETGNREQRTTMVRTRLTVAAEAGLSGAESARATLAATLDPSEQQAAALQAGRLRP